MLILHRIRPVALLALAVAVVTEVALATRDQMPVALIYPLALVAAGSAVWIMAGLDLLTRRNARPDRKDIAAVRALQFQNGARIDTLSDQLGWAEARVALLAAEPALTKAAGELCRIAARLEIWDRFEEELPLWNDAVERWRAALTHIPADLALDADPPTASEMHAARALLPATLNFSSAQLKPAIAYIVERERIVSVDARLKAHRKVLLESGRMLSALSV